MRKKRIIVRRLTRWTVEEWERGWQVAMSRMDGAPTIVTNDCMFQDCLTVLDGAFADGNGLQFELGLNALMDFCADSVEIGECEQWWKQEEAR
jgi:hypothetical protein